jgi:hypothetical protein
MGLLCWRNVLFLLSLGRKKRNSAPEKNLSEEAATHDDKNELKEEQRNGLLYLMESESSRLLCLAKF